MAQSVVTLQRVIMFLLVVVGGYIAVDNTLFHLVGPIPNSEPNAREHQTGVGNRPSSSSLPVSDVKRWDIFGSYKENGGYSVNASALPETELDMKLLGLFSDSERRRGAAIIAGQEDEVTLVSAGDFLEDSVRVVSILKDRVVLEKAGAKQAMVLIEWSDYESIELNVEEAEKPDQEKTSTEKATAPPSYSKFLEHAGLKPVTTGLAAGYRISKNAEGIQKKYNLREGDVILSINGYPVGEEADDRLAGSSLMEGRGEMIVLRDGRSFPVKIRP